MTLNLDEIDYYTLLGVDPRASIDQIRSAFHAFARSHHPDNFMRSSEAERNAAEARYRRATEAYRVLLSIDKRRIYDEGLAQGQLRFKPKRASDNDRGGTKALTGKARAFYGAARQSIAERDWKQAKLSLQMALQHAPDHPELLIELERVRRQMNNQ